MNNLDFIVSEDWIKYSHKRYLPLDDIRHRKGFNKNQKEWKDLKNQFQETRRLQSFQFKFPSINKTFWYFEADCIKEKILKIVNIGSKIYNQIHLKQDFEESLLDNSLVEEAITSAIYEGANTTRRKAKEFLAQNIKPKNKADWMCFNNTEALRWIKKNVSMQLDINAVLNIHHIVTNNTLEGKYIDYIGKFRDDPVFVADHEGIEYEKIEIAVQEAISHCTEYPRYIHELIRGIMLHYFIAYIHPFFDGNGRCARTLFYHFGMKNDLPFLELLSLSAYLKKHNKQYDESFKRAVTHDGDITYFVNFNLEALLNALLTVKEKIDRVLKIQVLKKTLDISNHQLMLIQKLFLNKHKRLTITEYAKDIKKSHEMARVELNSLAKKNILNKLSLNKKQNAYQINKKYINELLGKLT
ncbi:MAG: Fic family protein [Pseudomonadota bacterium]